MNWGNLEGLIPLLGGIYAYLLVTGVLPKNPKNPEKLQKWRQKYGRIIKILSPILVVYGILQLLDIL